MPSLSDLPWVNTRAQIIQTLGTVTSAAIAAGSLLYKSLSPSPPYWAQALGWTALGATFAMIASIVTTARREREADTPPISEPAPSALVTVDVFMENNDDAPQITYKRKLRVLVRNESGERITIGPGARWIGGTTDIGTMPRPNVVWQVEGTRGWRTDNWAGNEAAELIVPPNGVARAWIPLLPDASDVDVRRRHEVKTLGTLRVPVEMSGSRFEQELRL